MEESSFIHMHGASLGLLLHAVNDGCDGLLFGQVKVKEKTFMRDTDAGSGKDIVHEKHTYITGFHANATSLSFYDEAGIVQGDKLRSTLPHESDPMVGWFSTRPGPLQPSMREAGVTLSLTRHLPEQQTPLLAVLSRQTGHHMATQTIQFRFYEAQPQKSNQSLQPKELHIMNLACSSQSGHKAYSSFDPVMTKHAGNSEASPALHKLSGAVSQQMQQVEAFQDYTQSLLRELQIACKLASGAAALSSLSEEGEELSRQLVEV